MKADDLPEESNESIVVECELDEPREKVWRALTVPEIVAEWMNVENVATPSREKRERPANQSLDPTQLEYEVIAAEPPSQLQYRLREGDGRSVESTVTFELSDTPTGGTRLRIVHDAFEQAAIQPEMPYVAAGSGAERTARDSSALSPSELADAFLQGGPADLTGASPPVRIYNIDPIDPAGALPLLRIYNSRSRTRRALNRRRSRTLCFLRTSFRVAA
jgi:uncharacterized protein YndB with AHSA1/START domain